jgi:hypothetical protein
MGLGSGIRKKAIPDPGVKKAPDPGSATLNDAGALQLEMGGGGRGWQHGG